METSAANRGSAPKWSAPPGFQPQGPRSQTSKEILTEMAGLKRHQHMPSTILWQKNIEAFCKVLKATLQDRETQFGKQYLRLLMDEIKVDGKEVWIRGSYAMRILQEW